MLSTIQDVTEKLQAEEQLEARLRQQQAVADFGEYAIRTPDLDEVLNRAVTVVTATFWFGADQLRFDVPGQAMPARYTDKKPPDPAVLVAVRLISAAVAPAGTPEPLALRSQGRGVLPTSGAFVPMLGR